MREITRIRRSERLRDLYWPACVNDHPSNPKTMYLGSPGALMRGPLHLTSTSFCPGSNVSSRSYVCPSWASKTSGTPRNVKLNFLITPPVSRLVLNFTLIGIASVFEIENTASPDGPFDHRQYGGPGAPIARI